MPPRSLVSSVYCAWPSARRSRSFDSTRCRKSWAPRAGDLDLAHVRDVEDAGGRADGPVLVVDARVVARACPSRRSRSSGRRAQGGSRAAASSAGSTRMPLGAVVGTHGPKAYMRRFAAGLVGSRGRRGAASDTMRRPVTLIGLVLATTLTIPAAAHAATPSLLFPVVGGATYFDDYGAPACPGRPPGQRPDGAEAHAGDRRGRRRRAAAPLRARRLDALPAQLASTSGSTST